MTEMIKTFTCAVMLGAVGLAAASQQGAAPNAIRVRVHGTFIDAQGGGGVLSGDATVSRFEVRAGALVARTDIDGALADSAGGVIGHVDQEVVLTIGKVVSTCNQLSMEVSRAEIDVLRTPVHLEEGVAGYDSRHGGVPASLDALCRVADTLKTRPAPDVLAAVLNNVVSAIGKKQP